MSKTFTFNAKKINGNDLVNIWEISELHIHVEEDIKTGQLWIMSYLLEDDDD